MIPHFGVSLEKKAVSLVQLPFYIPLDTPFSSFLADQVTI
jgi:hypothetical protein